MTIQWHRDDGKAVCNINGVWLSSLDLEINNVGNLTKKMGD